MDALLGGGRVGGMQGRGGTGRDGRREEAGEKEDRRDGGREAWQC